MYWRVRLEGDRDDLNDLSKIFTNSELTIKENEGNFFLYSDSFNKLKESSQVEERGKEFLLIINAGLKITSNYLQLVKIVGVELLDTKGKAINTFVHVSSTVGVRAKARAKITKNDGTVIEDNPFESLLRWQRIAQTDSLVARAFYLISNDFDTWFSLYKLLEILEEDGFEPIGRKGKYRNEADRFSQTAQSYSALGLDARHIKSKFEAPPKPMTHSEAKSFIRFLVGEWLKTK